MCRFVRFIPNHMSLQSYTMATKANEAAYKDLSKTDTEMSQTIASQTQRLRQLQVRAVNRQGGLLCQSMGLHLRAVGALPHVHTWLPNISSK